jgi:hypothetical protein
LRQVGLRALTLRYRRAKRVSSHVVTATIHITDLRKEFESIFTSFGQTADS